MSLSWTLAPRMYPELFFTRYLQYLNGNKVIFTGLEHPLLPGRSKSEWDNCVQLFNCPSRAQRKAPQDDAGEDAKCDFLQSH